MATGQLDGHPVVVRRKYYIPQPTAHGHEATMALTTVKHVPGQDVDNKPAANTRFSYHTLRRTWWFLDYHLDAAVQDQREPRWVYGVPPPLSVLRTPSWCNLNLGGERSGVRSTDPPNVWWAKNVPEVCAPDIIHNFNNKTEIWLAQSARMLVSLLCDFVLKHINWLAKWCESCVCEMKTTPQIWGFLVNFSHSELGTMCVHWLFVEWMCCNYMCFDSGLIPQSIW